MCGAVRGMQEVSYLIVKPWSKLKGKIIRLEEMKTLKIIRIVGGVVFASAAVYFFIEKEYTEAAIQIALFLFLSLIPLVFNKENE